LTSCWGVTRKKPSLRPSLPGSVLPHGLRTSSTCLPFFSSPPQHRVGVALHHAPGQRVGVRRADADDFSLRQRRLQRPVGPRRVVGPLNPLERAGAAGQLRHHLSGEAPLANGLVAPLPLGVGLLHHRHPELALVGAARVLHHVAPERQLAIHAHVDGLHLPLRVLLEEADLVGPVPQRRDGALEQVAVVAPEAGQHRQQVAVPGLSLHHVRSRGALLEQPPALHPLVLDVVALHGRRVRQVGADAEEAPHLRARRRLEGVLRGQVGLLHGGAGLHRLLNLLHLVQRHLVVGARRADLLLEGVYLAHGTEWLGPMCRPCTRLPLPRDAFPRRAA